ncbi:hypothetical protein MSAN_01901200 [Mycena sanguinolenta]|uniref:Uncharacterized protein n=1 Tax=Mycena sanguinolenta TaxID=230812 RepID=A0A8H6XRQ4_9AGAR|nr:hypothetical protein MSAN_01901200 [Mycena sanguinolenta]
MLVASRVKDWVESPSCIASFFLSSFWGQPKRRYRFPILPADIFLQKIAGKTPSFLEAAAKYLCVDYDLPTAEIATPNSVLRHALASPISLFTTDPPQPVCWLV